jgi:hypothetical protein
MSEIARHWIDGQWRASPGVAESTDPATSLFLSPQHIWSL